MPRKLLSIGSLAAAVCLIMGNTSCNPPPCSVMESVISVPPANSGGGFEAIDPSGSVIATHGYGANGYFGMTATHPIDGMKDRDAWMTETREILNDVIYAPWRDEANVRPMNGWGEHGGAQDVNVGGWTTFPVYAMADGVVIWSGYMPSPGNSMVIEYSLANGEKFRSDYRHLRNGRDNDIALAQATRPYCVGKGCDFTNCSSDCGTWIGYQAMADADAALLLSDPNHPDVEEQWGTNAQTLMVQQGDTVRAGQQIGWAGDTGVHSGSVHLHWAAMREAVHLSNGTEVTRWTRFDPTGQYAQARSCYEGSHPSGGSSADARQHASLMAPVYRYFAQATSSVYQAGWDYFADLGWFPTTLASDYQTGVGRTLAGEFRPRNNIPGRHFRPFDEHQADWSYWWSQGWVPEQITVESRGGPALYSSLYMQRAGGFWGSHKMTPSWLDSRDDQLASQGYVLVDFAPYAEAGQLYFSAQWEQRPGDSVALDSLTRAELDAHHQSMAGSGYRMVRVHRYDHTDGIERYAALWDATFAGNTFYAEHPDHRSYRQASTAWEAWGAQLLHVSANDGEFIALYEY